MTAISKLICFVFVYLFLNKRLIICLFSLTFSPSFLIFGCVSWRPALEEREVGGGLGEMVGENYGQNVFYKRRIYFQ